MWSETAFQQAYQLIFRQIIVVVIVVWLFLVARLKEAERIGRGTSHSNKAARIGGISGGFGQRLVRRRSGCHRQPAIGDTGCKVQRTVAILDASRCKERAERTIGISCVRRDPFPRPMRRYIR